MKNRLLLLLHTIHSSYPCLTICLGWNDTSVWYWHPLHALCSVSPNKRRWTRWAGDAIARLLPWQSRLHVLLLSLRRAKSHLCCLKVNHILYKCRLNLSLEVSLISCATCNRMSVSCWHDFRPKPTFTRPSRFIFFFFYMRPFPRRLSV